MNTVREEAASLIDRLPPDASIEDVQYHLYVIDKVRAGLKSIETEGGLSQEEVEERLRKTHLFA